MRWKLRPAYFRGAGIYTVAVGGRETITLSVDKNGYFTTDRRPTIPIGVCATRAGWFRRLLRWLATRAAAN
jgi:hypothetical protein